MEKKITLRMIGFGHKFTLDGFFNDLFLTSQIKGHSLKKANKKSFSVMKYFRSVFGLEIRISSTLTPKDKKIKNRFNTCFFFTQVEKLVKEYL